MSVALVNFLSPIQFIGFRRFIQNTRIRAETQGAADILYAILIRQKCDNRVRSLRIEFDAVCFLQSGYMACIFDNCELHTKAESKKRNVMCSCISNSFDFSVNTAIPKASGYKDTVCACKVFICIFFCYIF